VRDFHLIEIQDKNPHPPKRLQAVDLKSRQAAGRGLAKEYGVRAGRAPYLGTARWMSKGEMDWIEEKHESLR
jgi:hypothetical protein